MKTRSLPIRQVSVAAGTAACVASLLFTAPVAHANDAIDAIITQTVQPRARIDRPSPATQGFKAALDQIDSGNYADVYEMARGFSDPIERRVIQWAAIYYGGGDIDHYSVLRFQEDAPDFASAALYKRRMEQALTKTTPSHSDAIALLGGSMPMTLDAQLMLARAYVADGQVERAGRIIKSIWVNDFINAEYETKIRGEFGKLLDLDDHWNRAIHLLMHDRVRGAERLMDFFTPAQKSLVVARAAVSRNEKSALTLLQNVDPSYRDHSLYLFARGQDARHRGDLDTAISYLGKAGGNAIDSAEFWYELRLISRRALADGNARLAYKAAAAYTDGPEGRVVDARFHAGWIALSFLKDPATAKTHFTAMRAQSTLPGSITQSNYWLGRSLKALGEDAAAHDALQIAAQYHTLYYGQLAREALGMKGIGLRALPEWRQSEAQFEQRQLVRAVRLLAENNRAALAEPLVRTLAQSLKDPGELLLSARLGQSIGAHNLAVLIADIADKRGVALDVFSFPKDGLPNNIKLANVDRAAIYAIARQESRFDVDAVSHAGARGLMQLMPATAKETARKIGLNYSPSKLTSDPAYNALIGSTYLEGQLDRYDGSLILAAAGYNAGAGNANKWIKAFGDPRTGAIDPVDWIEAIPFVETRKYVQRVMGNYMVYRARLGDESLTISQALKRIPH